MIRAATNIRRWRTEPGRTIRGSMVNDLRESPSLAGRAQSARRVSILTATKIAAIPVVVGLLMLASSGAEPLDHDVPEARETAEQFATTWLRGSSAQAIRFVSDEFGITVEQLDREREYFDSHDFEIVGPASFVSDTFVAGQPGYAVPLEGLQGSHRLAHTLVVVMTDDWQGWKVMGWGWSVNEP
jgi:hypothetical protein